MLCDGRALMDGGVVLIIDETRALAEAGTRGARIGADSGLAERARPSWPML